MATAAIISIGNELLSGLTADTNSVWLAGRLGEAGIETVSIRQVRDLREEISAAIRYAAEQAEIILLTGGLGPTDDDLTRHGLADFLGVDLEFCPDLLADIQAFFDRRSISMVERNRIQAHLPRGANPIHNPVGTAPGILAGQAGRLIAALPGVPMEMQEMFHASVAPLLQSRGGGTVAMARRIRCFGVGESTLAEMLGNRMDRCRNPLINCTVSGSVITLHIVARAHSREAAEVMIEHDREELVRLLGDLVFGCDDQTLPGVVLDSLRRAGRTIALAESCTGGLIAKLLTDVPGASDCLEYAWVTYSNQAKVSELGVDPDLLVAHGAVSEPVARAMAAGARRRSGADIGLSVTGIAGPGGGTEQKPVGLVYIGVDCGGVCQVDRRVFSHSRQAIRLRTALTALNLVRLRLSN